MTPGARAAASPPSDPSSPPATPRPAGAHVLPPRGGCRPDRPLSRPRAAVGGGSHRPRPPRCPPRGSRVPPPHSPPCRELCPAPRRGAGARPRQPQGRRLRPSRAGSHKMTSRLGKHRSAALRHRRGTAEGGWGLLRDPQHCGSPAHCGPRGVAREGGVGGCWVRAPRPPQLRARDPPDEAATWGEKPLCVGRPRLPARGAGCRTGGGRGAAGPGGHSEAGGSLQGGGDPVRLRISGVLVRLGSPGGAGGCR